MNQSVYRAQLVEKAKRMKPPKAKFQFGKYKGKTLKWVEENDPEYIVWVGDTVAKTYRPVGFQEAYNRCKNVVQDMVNNEEHDEYLEQWAREIADE